MMVGRLILRGLVVGILAGLLAFGWARAFGEQSVNTAIGFEHAQDEAKEQAAIARGQPPEPEEPEIFSRTVQSGIGLLAGMVGVGAGLGGLFGVMFAFANGRMGNLRPGATSIVIAALGLLSLYVIPALKYPADPPSVGQPDTIQLRTGLYFLMLAISIASTLFALWLRAKFMPAQGQWNASILAGAAYFLIIAGAFLLMPSVNEVPALFPAVTLWDFRIASLGIQVVLWMSIGLIFGYLAEREYSKA